jgi:hypothetical protein
MSRIVAVICIGLVSGAMAEEYFVLRLVLEGLEAGQWGQAQAAFGHFHPWTVIPLAIVGTIAVFTAAVLERPRNSSRAVLTWIVAGISATIGVLTIGVMFPLNQGIEQWVHTGVPENWQEIRERWIALQALRAALAILGYIPLVIASHLRPAHDRQAA